MTSRQPEDPDRGLDRLATTGRFLAVLLVVVAASFLAVPIAMIALLARAYP